MMMMMQHSRPPSLNIILDVYDDFIEDLTIQETISDCRNSCWLNQQNGACQCTVIRIYIVILPIVIVVCHVPSITGNYACTTNRDVARKKLVPGQMTQFVLAIAGFFWPSQAFLAIAGLFWPSRDSRVLHNQIFKFQEVEFVYRFKLP